MNLKKENKPQASADANTDKHPVSGRKLKHIATPARRSLKKVLATPVETRVAENTKRQEYRAD